jgi:hypothetical protein
MNLKELEFWKAFGNWDVCVCLTEFLAYLTQTLHALITLSSLTYEYVRTSKRRRVASLVAAMIEVLGGGMDRKTVIGGLRAESNCSKTQPINGSHRCTTESQEAARRSESRNVIERTVLRWPEYVHWHCDMAVPSPCTNHTKKLHRLISMPSCPSS